MSASFPDATTDDYEHIIPALTNEEKDRHVLAAGVRSGAQVILTFNLKDFPNEALKPWGIVTKHPQDYLINLYSMEPQILVRKIAEIAAEKNRDLEAQVLKLGKSVPKFCSLLIDDLKLQI